MRTQPGEVYSDTQKFQIPSQTKKNVVRLMPKVMPLHGSNLSPLGAFPFQTMVVGFCRGKLLPEAFLGILYAKTYA